MKEGIKIPYVSLPVSPMVYGCGTAPMIAGEDVSEFLDKVYGMGITAFDTAENYGKSEISLGRWINSRNLRNRVTVISKGCHPYGRDRVNPEDFRHDIEKSFEQLKTDYIDIYFLHRDDLKVPVGPLVEMLNDYHKAGKIGAFGGSNWTPARIAEANAYAKAHGLVPFTVSSPNYCLAGKFRDPWGGGAGCVSISGDAGREAREFYRREKMPVFAWSSLGNGFFSGRIKSSDPEGAKALLSEGAVKGFYFPENFERLKRAEEIAAEKGTSTACIALAYLMSQNFTVFPVVSSGNAERLAGNLKAADLRLSPAELSYLDLGGSRGIEF
ncbi:MAG TPA: aldo/keto reductase [Lachnospiraceae bacterium]|nr:aldo/keto reductase [Lachnospiraceae bacterium]